MHTGRSVVYAGRGVPEPLVNAILSAQKSSNKELNVEIWRYFKSIERLMNREGKVQQHGTALIVAIIKDKLKMLIQNEV